MMFLCESMSGHVSFRLGGCVEVFIVPNSLESLVSTIKFLRNENLPFRVLGNGTNIVPGDGFIETLVVSTERVSELSTDGTKIYASTGVSFKRLCQFALKTDFPALKRLTAYQVP